MYRKVRLFPEWLRRAGVSCGRDRPVGSVLDRVGPGRGALRPGVEPVRLARPVRRGGQGRLQGPRPVARRHRAPAGEPHAGGDEQDLQRRRADLPRGRVPRRLLRRPGRPGARPSRTSGAGCCSTRPPPSARTTSRSATSPARRAARPAHRRVRRAVRRTPPATPTRRSSTSSCRSTSTSTRSTPRCGRGQRRRPAERRAGHRHLAHGQARDRARRTCAGSRPST